jgi:predicted metal-dependent peptidase
MEQQFYPLLETFLEKLRSGRLDEVASNEVIASIPKLIESEAAVSPYTGKTINVKKVHEEMEKAKYKIITQSPLYRPYVHDMDPTIYTWIIPTMATDGVRLFVNPEFAAELSWMGKIFVIIHEIMHCILLHDQRGGGFDHDLFNQAADFEINDIIVDTTDDFDAKFVTDEIHGLYDIKYLNIPAEQIYADLLKNPPKLPPPPPSAGQGQGKPQPGQGQGQPQPGQGQGQGQPQQGQGQPGQGQGQGQPGQGQGGQPGQGQGQGKPQPGQGQGAGSGATDEKAKKQKEAQETANAEQRALAQKMKGIDGGRAGAIIDKRTGEQIAAASGYDEAEARAGDDARAKWESNAKEIAKTAQKMKDAGSGRGDALINRIGKIMKSSSNWKSILKNYVGTALSPEKEYRIGAKKHLYKSDEYLRRGLKVKKDALKRVVVCVDVSGSIFSGAGGGSATFEKIIGEINSIIFSNKIKEITIIFFDDGVDKGSIQVIKPKGKKIWLPTKVKGGGGTNFQKPLDWIHNEYKDSISLCIFLTDGYATNPATPKYSNKFIWIVYDNFDWEKPFGKVIKTSVSDMT